MGIEREEAARDFLLEFEGERLDDARIERILGRMAPDARYHVFAWHEPCVGHDAIRDELLRQAPLFGDTHIEFLNTASSGSTVFIERVDWCTMNDVNAGFHVVGVSEIDANGKIASWRDYADSREIAVKVATGSRQADA